MLFYPDLSKGFIFHTGASDIGCGVMLSQTFKGEEHRILYLSQNLFLREKTYSVIEKGGLAMKLAIDILLYYLLGNPFLLNMDHTPHKWLHTMKDTNIRTMHWYLVLQPY